jgi:hypothetical protein
MKKQLLQLALISTLSLNLSCAGSKSIALPLYEPALKECTFKEAYSSSEVMLKSSGWGETVELANDDLLRSAIWFLLYNGTDPLLNSSESKAAFEKVKSEYSQIVKIRSFVSWEAEKIDQQLSQNLYGRDGYKRTKHIRINKEALKQDLVKKGILVSLGDLTESQGNPSIMVIPETKKGESPIQVLDNNNLARHAAGVIESHLTAKQYEVVVPRGIEQLNEVTKLQSEMSTSEEDPSYQLALSLGSDIYLVYSGQVQNGKASIVVKAYETTTGRALGTETGYSQQRPGTPMEPLVEEAINDGIDKVLQRLNNYWTADLKKGVQYKVIFKFVGNFSKNQLQQAKDDIAKTLEDEFKTKENIITDKTADWQVWAKSEDYGKSSKISRFVRSKLNNWSVNEININKKLIILSIEKQ